MVGVALTVATTDRQGVINMAFRKVEKSFKTNNRYTSKWPQNVPPLKRADVHPPIKKGSNGK